jgi:hypothetical protein
MPFYPKKEREVTEGFGKTGRMKTRSPETNKKALINRPFILRNPTK